MKYIKKRKLNRKLKRKNIYNKIENQKYIKKRKLNKKLKKKVNIKLFIGNLKDLIKFEF
jgi:ribosome-binding protein aMBF1 (putative translation factor)